MKNVLLKLGIRVCVGVGRLLLAPMIAGVHMVFWRSRHVGRCFLSASLMNRKCLRIDSFCHLRVVSMEQCGGPLSLLFTDNKPRLIATGS